MKTLIVFMASHDGDVEPEMTVIESDTFDRASARIASHLRDSIVRAFESYSVASVPTAHDDPNDKLTEFIDRAVAAEYIEQVGDIISELHTWLDEECYGSYYEPLRLWAVYIDHDNQHARPVTKELTS